MTIRFLVLALAFTALGDPQEEPRIVPFAIEHDVDEPEDIHFPDGSSIGFVSNINGESTALDGNGYISRIHVEGGILERRWVAGLNGPKGMRDDGRHLYVADINAVVQIDMESAVVVARFEATNAGMLNDIAIGPDRTLYVSDSSRDVIWRKAAEDESLAVWARDDPNLKTVNGLYATPENLLAVSTSTGALISIDYGSAEIHRVAEGLGMADGIEGLDSGRFLVSDLTGRMHTTDAEAQSHVLFVNRELSANNDFGLHRQARIVVIAHRAGRALSWRYLPESFE